MNVTFYGAVREVTGSMHLLTTDEDRVILDCGLFQGRRKETAEKNKDTTKIVTGSLVIWVDAAGSIPRCLP